MTDRTEQTAGEAMVERINARLRTLISQVGGITLGIDREPTLNDLDRVLAVLENTARIIGDIAISE